MAGRRWPSAIPTRKRYRGRLDERAHAGARGSLQRPAAAGSESMPSSSTAPRYLLHQFLSPLCERRTMSMGRPGDRHAVPLEVFDAVRAPSRLIVGYDARIRHDWLTRLGIDQTIAFAQGWRHVVRRDSRFDGGSIRPRDPVGPSYQGHSARVKRQRHTRGCCRLITDLQPQPLSVGDATGRAARHSLQSALAVACGRAFRAHVKAPDCMSSELFGQWLQFKRVSGSSV